MSSTYLERFAYAVARLDELEPIVGAALARRLETGEDVQTIVVAPRQSHLGTRDTWQQRLGFLLPWRWTPAWVLLLTNRRLLVATIAQPGAEPTVASIAPAALLHVELGSILLLGWFECAWVEGSAVQRVRIYFNTVGDELFRRLRDALCADPAGASAGAGAQEAPAPADRAHNSRALEHLPFKFRGIIAYQLLLPGERVAAVAFQPTIWRTRYRLFQLQVAPAKALVLTNLHLLVAAEERSYSEKNYGMIARYYPRRTVLGADLEPREESLWLTLRAGLHQVEESDLLQFEPDAEPALMALLGQLEPREERIPLHALR